MMQNGQLDQVDYKILNILQQNARLDTIQIAQQVFKSPTATHERIRKLQEKGFIQRYIAVLDRKLIGRPTLMITLVKLNHHASQTLRDFAKLMYAQPEIQVCLHLSGEYDFLLQVSMKGPVEYEEFLDSFLLDLPMVDKIQSSLVLKECKMEAALPLS